LRLIPLDSTLVERPTDVGKLTLQIGYALLGIG
jgi:hypothetical protein